MRSADGIDHVIVRPTGLASSPGRGTQAIAVTLNGPVPVSRIARADVATFMLDQVSGNEFVGKAPGISWRDK